MHAVDATLDSGSMHLGEQLVEELALRGLRITKRPVTKNRTCIYCLDCGEKGKLIGHTGCENPRDH